MSLEFSPDPRQESEARITALLLGEITGAEAASLLETIEADPQLAALYERLKKTVVLVQEVSANPAQPIATPGANPAVPLKLSEERRQKLLAQFKTVKPKEFARVEKRSPIPSWVMPVGIAAAIVALLSTLAIPNFQRARTSSQQAAILNNLRQLDGAKQEWALEHHAGLDAVPTFAQIQPYMGRGVSGSLPEPIAGEKYVLGRLDQAPVAVAKGKVYTLEDEGKAQVDSMTLAEKRPAPSVEIRAKFVDVTPTAAPTAPAPQQLAQNNRQQIYLPPADNGVTLSVTPAAPAANSGRGLTWANDSVQQFGTSGSIGGGGAGGGGAGNATTPLATNAADFHFYIDLNGNGANVYKPEQASGFDNSSQLYASTNGVIGNNAYAGDPAWVGILNEPSQPHSPSNYFISRFDSLGVPIGSNLDLDSIHNQPNLQNNFSDASIAAAQNNNVTLSFNTQPKPALPRGDAIVVLRPPPNTSLADQLNEPQVVTKSGRRVQLQAQAEAEAKQKSGEAQAESPQGHFPGVGAITQDKGGLAGLQNQGVGQAEVPLLGDVPSLGSIFSNTTPSQAGVASNESFARRLQERISVAANVQTTDSLQAGDRRFKTPQSPHGAQLLTQRTEPAKRPQGVTPLPGSRAPEAETAATPPPAPVAAPPLASESIPDQFAIKQEDGGGMRLPATTPPQSNTTLSGYVDSSVQWNLGTGNANAPAYAFGGAGVITPTNHGLDSDDLSLQKNNAWGYGNANPDKAKNFGGSTSASASDKTRITTREYSNSTLPGQTAFQLDPETHGIIGLTDAETLKQIQEKINKLDSTASNSVNDKDSRRLLVLYDTKKKELEDLQKSRDQLARTNPSFAGGAMLGPRPDPLAEVDLEIREKQTQMAALDKRMGSVETLSSEAKVATPDVNDAPLPKPVMPPPVPQPEVFTSTNAFSTFSLNIADVSFKLAAASLEKGMMPAPASIRSEEFINAFDYRDPEAPPGVPIAFAWERARYPFAQNRDLLRFSLKTAATGRAPGRPLNIVLLLDNSGSMERADRVQIIREALRVLASQLQPQDTLSIVTFARTPRLFVDGVPGNQATNVAQQVSDLTPQGGTNLEDAMRLAYETALRHYLANGINRVVLLTDGAANLGNVDPESLKQSVEAHRKQGIALDCFGIGWEGYNDDLLEVLARNGDGRYGFLNSPEEAANGFAHQLAGALNVAAEDVKVQVEFNPRRVTLYRQIGYAKLQLTKEQFRDNTVAAAQVGAAEAGNALYTLQVDPNGDGPLATVRVRYKVPGTQDVEEHEWSVPYAGNAVSLEQSSPAMRLAGTASAFSEWLANSPYATEVTPDALLQDLTGVPATFAPDTRPQKLVEMIREAKSISGK